MRAEVWIHTACVNAGPSTHTPLTSLEITAGPRTGVLDPAFILGSGLPATVWVRDGLQAQQLCRNLCWWFCPIPQSPQAVPFPAGLTLHCHGDIPASPALGGCFSIVHRAATLLLPGLTFHFKSFFWLNSNCLHLNKIGAACQEGRVVPCRVATQWEESELDESKQFNGPWRIPSTSKGRNQEFTVSRSHLSRTAVNVGLWLQRTHEFYTTWILPISHRFPAVLSAWFMLCASAFTTNTLLPFIMCGFVCHVISYNPSKTLQ